MKRTVLLFLLTAFTTTVALSQLREYILPAKTKVNKVHWRDSVYLLTSFHEGEVTFDTGFKPPQKHLLNFNILLNRMDEITPKGDTVAMDASPLEHSIQIAHHLFRFFRKKGYMKILAPGKVTVATFYYFDAGRVAENNIGYQSDKGRIQIQGDDPNRFVEYDRSYVLHIEPYLIANNTFYHSRKSNILSLYEHDSGVVEWLMDKHKVNLGNKDSLITFIQFCNNLGPMPESTIPGMFRVKAGDRISGAWSDSLYLFPQFMRAEVTGIANPKSTRSFIMNYNLLTEQMEYITDAGDTARLNSYDVNFVSFDDRHLYKQPDGKYAELLIRGIDSFFELKRLNLVQEYKSPSASKSGRRGEDISSDRLYVIKSSHFFLSQRSQSVYPADKAGFVKAFPKSRKMIDEYLEACPVDFQKRNDLMRLISFCLRY